MDIIYKIKTTPALNDRTKSFITKFYSSKNNQIPLFLALLESNKIEHLLNLGYPIDFKIDEETILVTCVEFCSEKKSQLLIDNGADVNQHNRSGVNIFFIASAGISSNEFLIYLFKKGADINSNCFQNINALDYALKYKMNLNRYWFLKKLGAKSDKSIFWQLKEIISHYFYKRTGFFRIFVWYYNKFKAGKEI